MNDHLIRANNNKGQRSLIMWEVPHLGSSEYIEMYINPNSLATTSRKLISEKRAKGGYIIQYWGEELDILAITGTTGASGIEGVKALEDIYRSEQLALLNIIKKAPEGTRRRQSLAQLASSVIMWYQNKGHQGYFTDMTINETANELGLFNYSLNFKITRTIGERHNFMPWHRRPKYTSNSPYRPESGAPRREVTIQSDLSVPFETISRPTDTEE